MTVREYIGARYVPLFIGEWSSENAYEPLSIVIHEGNSYTSRQAVPIGIEITNEAYWSLTGNYNAQVEQYRQEVANFEADISQQFEDLSDDFDEFKSIEFTSADIRRYGAKEKDATVNWVQIIENCAANSDAIYFPAGEWYITEMLDLTGKNFVTVCGNMAKLTVVSNTTLEAVIKFEAKKASDTPVAVATVDGIFFNCAGKATAGLKTICANVNISNCKFMDYIQYGIDASRETWQYNLGKKIINCEFGDDAAEHQATQTAISITSDSQVIGCKFFGQKVCIEHEGANIFMGNLFYAGDDNVERCIGIKGIGNTVDTIITNNQFDTIPACIENMQTGVVENNLFMWNTAVQAPGEYTIFNRTIAIGGYYTPSLQGTLVFSNNMIHNFANSSKIVHTFINEVETLPVLRYVSENNSLRGADNARIANVRVAFGLDGYNYATNDPNLCFIFEPIANTPASTIFTNTLTYTKQGVPSMHFQINDTGGTAVAAISEFNLNANTTAFSKRLANSKRFGIRLQCRQMIKVRSEFALIHEGRIVAAATYDNETASYTSDSIRYNCNLVQ